MVAHEKLIKYGSNGNGIVKSGEEKKNPYFMLARIKKYIFNIKTSLSHTGPRNNRMDTDKRKQWYRPEERHK